MLLPHYCAIHLKEMSLNFIVGPIYLCKKGAICEKKIYIGQKIGYITILYFCKKSLIVIKPTFI